MLVCRKEAAVIMSELRKFGYCRISTEKQNLERQIRNIKAAYPDAIIRSETYTGRKVEGRKVFDSILKNVKPGEWIIFDSVSRMSRNADDGCALYEELFHKGIVLVFLKEPHINTSVYKDAVQKEIDVYINTGNKATDTFLNNIIEALNKFVIDLAKEQIRIAFEQAEKEVEDLRQRTKEGIETARLKGKQIGHVTGTKLVVKKEAPAKSIILKHSKSFGGSLKDEECMKLARVSRATYYKYKREIRYVNESRGV